MRDILAWQVCDICHRRLATTTCQVDGRVLRVCEFCLELLAPSVLSCAQQRARPVRRRSVEINEGLIGSLASEETPSGEAKRESRPRARHRSAGRT